MATAHMWKMGKELLACSIMLVQIWLPWRVGKPAGSWWKSFLSPSDSLSHTLSICLSYSPFSPPLCLSNKYIIFKTVTIFQYNGSHNLEHWKKSSSKNLYYLKHWFSEIYLASVLWSVPKLILMPGHTCHFYKSIIHNENFKLAHLNLCSSYTQKHSFNTRLTALPNLSSIDAPEYKVAVNNKTFTVILAVSNKAVIDPPRIWEINALPSTLACDA